MIIVFSVRGAKACAGQLPLDRGTQDPRLKKNFGRESSEPRCTTGSGADVLFGPWKQGYSLVWHVIVLSGIVGSSGSLDDLQTGSGRYNV